jgi:adenylate cyclase
MRERRQRLRTLLFLTVALVAVGLGVTGYATDGLRDLELDTVDARFTIRGEKQPPADLVVVKIDDASFQDLNLQWPFPRDVHGEVIDRIARDRPAAIAYDVQFTEPTEDPKEDIALSEAIADADDRVVLATTEVNERGQTDILGGDEVLREIGAKPGNGLLPPDSGGVLRRVTYSVDGLKSLAVATTETATRRRVDPDRFDEDGGWIDYYGPRNTIEAVSFSRVARGRLRRGFFRDKLVVVGPTAPSLQDVHPTSTAGDDEMSGAEIQASALDTVRRGGPLESAPGGLDVALIVLLGLVAPVASLRIPPLRALALAVAVGAAFAVASQLAFNNGTVISFVYPVGALVLAAIGTLAIHYITAAFERERVRDLFSRFVPENVVDDVLARTDGLRLGGVQREGTVMFTDLRGFTSFAESLPVERVIEVLNVYLSEMSDAILNQGGTLVAYMGDGIMAVFGAPIEQPDHAERALASAREMLDERLGRFNAYLRSEGLSEEGFRMGIGLNSGSVMSGNVGSERRLEYTAIGDTTNTAARLEGMTKGTPHQLFIADSTRSLMKQEHADLVFVDEFEVRGRQAKVKIWSLGDERPSPAPTS